MSDKPQNPRVFTPPAYRQAGISRKAGLRKEMGFKVPPWGGMGVKPVDLWNRLFISESFDRISRRSSPALQAYG